MKLKDKVAVVAGGGSGMGETTARLFAQEGASVIVADLNEDAAEKVTASIIESLPGATVRHQKVDVTDEGSVEQLARFVAENFTAADILVNTFGIAEFTPMLDLTLDQWRRTTEVNLTGTFLTCRALGRQMVERRRGKIVNFGSTASLSAVPGMAHYTAAKHGVLGLTRTLAVEWGKYNIHVNCICPGATTTPLMVNCTTPQWREQRIKRIPLGKLACPENQARAALFLASDDSDYLTGAAIPTDGGVSATAAGTSDEALAAE
jgi:NAD(P)-dependent dehydrogenase (short-subunit alcohol dehydrogenase family)